MAKMDFLKKIQTYNKDNIPEDILKKVKPCVADIERVGIDKITSSSVAAGGMAKWCIEIYLYAIAIKVVKPLQI
jgi:hypothetical protein